MLPYTTEANVIKIVNEKIKEGGSTPSKDEIISIVNEAIEEGEIEVGGNGVELTHIDFVYDMDTVVRMLFEFTQSDIDTFITGTNEQITAVNTQLGINLPLVSKIDDIGATLEAAKQISDALVNQLFCKAYMLCCSSWAGKLVSKFEIGFPIYTCAVVAEEFVADDTSITTCKAITMRYDSTNGLTAHTIDFLNNTSSSRNISSNN